MLCGKRSRLAQKVEALDNFVRSEMHLLNEKIDTCREERDLFMKKLNETLENIERSVRETAAAEITHIKMSNERNANDADALFSNLLKNDEEIKQMSEELVCLKRRFMEEKNARKTGINALVTQLSRIEENQNEVIDILKGRQNESIKNQVDLINNIEALRNRTETYHNTIDSLKDKAVILEQTLGTQDHELISIQGQLANVDNTTETLVQIANNIKKASYFAVSVIKEKDVLYVQDC